MMTAIELILGTWRGIIATLVTCVLVMAPMAAQAKMAQHAASHSFMVVPQAHDHDGSVDGGVARNSHVAALAAHDHADHDHAMAHDPAPNRTGQQHDQRSHHDGSCCGTYCHSGCITTVAEDVQPVVLAGTYATFTPVSLTAVAPDQPQRPPSIPLSI